MNAQVNKFLHLPLVTAGIAAILVSGIALASLAVSGKGNYGGQASEEVAAPAIAAPSVGAYRCNGCGVIESTREVGAADQRTGIAAPGRIAPASHSGIEATPLRNYEITIRLQDGTMRVIRDPKPAKWRHGEPVTIIAGAD